jgi:hypothetical protein
MALVTEPSGDQSMAWIQTSVQARPSAGHPSATSSPSGRRVKRATAIHIRATTRAADAMGQATSLHVPTGSVNIQRGKPDICTRAPSSR